MQAERGDLATASETMPSVDLEGLREDIASALTRFPIDEPALRAAVSTYADAELALATPLGYVIVVLTELVEDANVAPFSLRNARSRQLTLWTIERYFGPKRASADHDAAQGADAWVSTSGSVNR